jgi:hypothetical protein
LGGGGEDLMDETLDGEPGGNGGNKEDLLVGIARNLDHEHEATSPLWKCRNVEASPAQEGTYASAAATSMLCSTSSFLVHLHLNK